MYILNRKNSTLLLALFIAIQIFSSCQSNTIKPTKNQDLVDALLKRYEKKQLGKEWESVQNNYAKYKNAIQENPKDQKSKIQLAQLFIQEARVTGEHGHYYPAALKTLNNALNNKSINPDLEFLALTSKAGVLLSLHEFKKALKVGNEAALLNPTNAQIHGVLIDANVELGHYKKAIALSDKMLSIKPDIRSYSRASYLREIHGDIDGSIEAMTMAVKAGYPGHENTAWAMLTLGDIIKKYKSKESAEKIFQSILETRPNYPFAYGALGQLQLEQGHLNSAEITLKKAIEIIPEVGFYISLAEVYKKQNRHAEMKILADEIFEMLEDDTLSGHNMNMEYSSIYLNLLENYDEALKYAQLEYEKRPKNINVNKLLSQIYFEMNDIVSANSHKKMAVIAMN